MKQLPKVLLVEDDCGIAATLAQALRSSYDLDVAASGQWAMHKANTTNYALIILDLGLPDISGMAVCQQLRDHGQAAPILILSGECSVMSKINLLDAGANDYLTKPFSLGELKARLRALGRVNHSTAAIPVGQLAACGLLLDRRTRKVSRNGVEIDLRRKEFALLECLMEHAGSVVTRSALIRYAWPGDDGLWTNTVDVHIKYLRDKVDRPFEQLSIQTVHGMGYKLETHQAAITAGKVRE